MGVALWRRPPICLPHPRPTRSHPSARMWRSGASAACRSPINPRPPSRHASVDPCCAAERDARAGTEAMTGASSPRRGLFGRFRQVDHSHPRCMTWPPSPSPRALTSRSGPRDWARRMSAWPANCCVSALSGSPVSWSMPRCSPPAIALGLGPWLGRVLSYLAAATTTFALNRAWTFRARQARPPVRQWALFLVVYLVGFAFNYGTYAVLIALVPLVAANPVLGVAAGSLAGLVGNFVLSRRFVFGQGGTAVRPAAEGRRRPCTPIDRHAPFAGPGFAGPSSFRGCVHAWHEPIRSRHQGRTATAGGRRGHLARLRRRPPAGSRPAATPPAAPGLADLAGGAGRRAGCLGGHPFRRHPAICPAGAWLALAAAHRLLRRADHQLGRVSRRLCPCRAVWQPPGGLRRARRAGAGRRRAGRGGAGARRAGHLPARRGAALARPSPRHAAGRAARLLRRLPAPAAPQPAARGAGRQRAAGRPLRRQPGRPARPGPRPAGLVDNDAVAAAGSGGLPYLGPVTALERHDPPRGGGSGRSSACPGRRSAGCATMQALLADYPVDVCLAPDLLAYRGTRRPRRRGCCGSRTGRSAAGRRW